MMRNRLAEQNGYYALDITVVVLVVFGSLEVSAVSINLTDPIFHNEDAARAYFEVDPLA